MKLTEILKRRKETIEARMQEIRTDLEGDKVEESAVEALEKEIEDLTAELQSVKAELDKLTGDDEQKDEGKEETEQSEQQEQKSKGDEEQRSAVLSGEKRDAMVGNIMKGLTTQKRKDVKEQEQRKAFANLLLDRISPAEARALGIENGAGNILVPEFLAKEIITYAQQENPLRRLGTTHTTKGHQGFPILVKKGTASRHKDERNLDNPIPQSDIGFDEVYLNPSETDALIIVTKKLLQMTDMPVEKVVIDELKKMYVRKEAEFMFSATDNPGSLINKAVDFKTTETDMYNKFVKIKNTVPTEKLKNARWLINRAALTDIETLKTPDGFPLLRTDQGIENGFGYRLIGFPVEVSDYVDGDTPDVPRLYFGDFSDFHIQDVIGTMEITKLVEKYSDTNHIGFKIWNLNDGQLVYSPFEPSVYKMELNNDAQAAG